MQPVAGHQHQERVVAAAEIPGTRDLRAVVQLRLHRLAGEVPGDGILLPRRGFLEVGEPVRLHEPRLIQ